MYEGHNEETALICTRPTKRAFLESSSLGVLNRAIEPICQTHKKKFRNLE